MKHPYILIIISPEVEQSSVVADSIYSVNVNAEDEDGTPRDVLEVMKIAQAKLADSSVYAADDYVVTHVIFREQVVWSRPQ